jgi:hypothetical protein
MDAQIAPAKQTFTRPPEHDIDAHGPPRKQDARFDLARPQAIHHEVADR